MEKKQEKVDLKKREEIQKITGIIIEKYQIDNYHLAYKVAKSAYENGIHLDKFQPKYYKEPFDLNEIIYYLIRKEKIITIPRKNNQTTTENLPTPATTIPFSTSKIKIKQRYNKK